ncbi:DNA pilot protein [Sigmofec virus UA08Rod_6581]|uniref:DNA pilot protein n=1 Tax=Sigmofec virus UA08Rod_6581 TaxID=2929235 RepID=A0A976R768_9VIRU|nr:DNA pilot protein [Sigmofec virus UA08Rod_6581]
MGLGSILTKGLKAVGGVLGGPVGSAAVSALGGIAGSLIGKKSQDSTNRQQRELAEYQYEKNLEMWNRNNEYNTPSAQMQRYQEAGLNPNLIYGSGSAIAGNSSSTPQYQAPQLKAFTDYGDLGATAAINSYNQHRVTNSNVALQEANAQKAMADADRATSASALDTIHATRELFNYNLDRDTRDLLIAKRREAVNNLVSSTNLNNANNSVAGVRVNQIGAMADYYRQLIKQSDANTRLSEKEIERKALEMTMLDVQIKQGKELLKWYEWRVDSLPHNSYSKGYQESMLKLKKWISDREYEYFNEGNTFIDNWKYERIMKTLPLLGGFGNGMSDYLVTDRPIPW